MRIYTYIYIYSHFLLHTVHEGGCVSTKNARYKTIRKFVWPRFFKHQKGYFVQRICRMLKSLPPSCMQTSVSVQVYANMCVYMNFVQFSQLPWIHLNALHMRTQNFCLNFYSKYIFVCKLFIRIFLISRRFSQTAFILKFPNIIFFFMPYVFVSVSRLLLISLCVHSLITTKTTAVQMAFLTNFKSHTYYIFINLLHMCVSN